MDLYVIYPHIIESRRTVLISSHKLDFMSSGCERMVPRIPGIRRMIPPCTRRINMEADAIISTRIRLYIEGDITVRQSIYWETELIVIGVTAPKVPLEGPSIICRICPIIVVRCRSEIFANIYITKSSSIQPITGRKGLFYIPRRIGQEIFSQLLIRGISPTIQFSGSSNNTSVLRTSRN